MMKKNIAVLGTGSDVGKSIVAAALCRVLAQKGVKVAPFKAQNMSNNSGITPEGLEMGRAQIVQAEAAGIVPHADMNPVLLKPTGDRQSQVVLNGVVHGDHTAADYHRNRDFYFQKACEAFDRLEHRFQRIILEGAGSCAEVNLMSSDIVNFPMARYADADVILVADIHRGGVFAQVVGTLECLDREYRDMIKGIIINRFRGDISLFRDGVRWIEERTGKKVLGVLPWYSDFRIDAEDSVEIEKVNNFNELHPEKPCIGIIRLPHIANFTDFHSLSKIKQIQTIFFDDPERLSKFSAVIIPGSKNTRSDLLWIMKNFRQALEAYHRKGGHIFGICGGYQMLGQWVEDPDGLEGKPGRTQALGLLPVHTVLQAPKTTTLSNFAWEGIQGHGYEIHMGRTVLHGGAPLLDIMSRNNIDCADMDGCVTEDRRIAGTYIHGFFDTGEIAEKWLNNICPDIVHDPDDFFSQREKDYELLGQHFETHIDLTRIL